MFRTSCKNVLVRGVNWVGDAVMTLPALRVLRKAIPESRISLLVKPWVSPLFEKDPNIDEILIYDDKYKGIIGNVRLSRMLNRKGFCSAILFQNAFAAAFITYLAGIEQRIGYNRDGRGFLLTEAVRVPHNINEMHHVNYYLSLLKKIGIKTHYSEPYLYLSLDERLQARSLLREMKRPILGINPGATYGLAKRWFPERFAEIADWFIKDTDGSVVVFGGKDEAEVAQEVEFFFNRQQTVKRTIFDTQQSFVTTKKTQSLNSSPIAPYSLLNLAGKTSLRELISLISECEVFVTNDSGPLHISYALGTPLVALFGSTDPRLTGPPPGMNRNRSVVLNPDISCSPCFERTCKKNNMMCMYAITSEDVYHGIKKLLPDRPAVFFDRDGTLCRDAGYLSRYDDLQIFADIDRVRLLKEEGFGLIGVTNQSGIAKGIIREDFVKEINSLFIERHSFDDFYYCPHDPEEHCPCRKPEPGMLFRARAEHRINLKRSYIVGDKETDMILARSVGAKGILVKTGQCKESPYADFVVEDLKGAVDFIIKDKRI
jgi:heptosyltransferase-2